MASIRKKVTISTKKEKQNSYEFDITLRPIISKQRKTLFHFLPSFIHPGSYS